MYTRRTDASTGLRLISLENNTENPVNINMTGDFAFNWSPDGNRIVFDAYPAGEPPINLFLYTFADSSVRKITNHSGPEGHPAWSPDGSLIVFGRGGDIFTITPEGTNLKQITTHAADDWHPCFSPDGQYITFTSDRSGNTDIWMKPAAGGALKQVTSHQSEDDRAAWSPNGSKIAFASDRSGNMEVWILSLEDNQLERVTFNNAYDSHPDWSPDGKNLAFASNRGGTWDVYTISAASTTVEKDQNSTPAIPERFQVLQNYPNPFNSNTTITFEIIQPAFVSIKIYAINGKLVRTLSVLKFWHSGNHQITWDGKSDRDDDINSGEYFCVFECEGIRKINKILYIK